MLYQLSYEATHRERGQFIEFISPVKSEFMWSIYEIIIHSKYFPVSDWLKSHTHNRPSSIYQYSNMAPRLSGQTSIFGVVFFVFKSLLVIEGQRKLQKFAILTRKPRSHARILKNRTWPIHHNQLLFSKFGKNLRHIESMKSKVQPAENYWTDDVKMTSKVQPAADYWTVDRENLGTRLCYILWAEKQRAKWRNSF